MLEYKEIKNYELWVGGICIDPLTKEDAEHLQAKYLDQGFDDVILQEVTQ